MFATGKMLRIFALAALLSTACGCVSGLPKLGMREASRTGDAIVFLDGAGGGGPIIDAGPEVQTGLWLAGFRGDFVSFRWQSGLGAVADLVMDNELKRARGKALAERLAGLRGERPEARISIISASTGTAIALYALETLPADVTIDRLVMLSSAMSADYDLTAALEHVRESTTVFASQRDGLLGMMIPILGSADRQDAGQRVAGIIGFVPPDDAKGENGSPYDRVETLFWSSRMRLDGHFGGHTDYKNALFIARVIAPRLLEDP